MIAIKVVSLAPQDFSQIVVPQETKMGGSADELRDSGLPPPVVWSAMFTGPGTLF